MTVALGLDIGTNSVGSAWIDTESKTIQLAVSIFPAGVKVSDKERGEPVNVARRQARSQRRSIRRRALRKRVLMRQLIDRGLLPSDAEERKLLFQFAPEDEDDKAGYIWRSRRRALSEALTPFEFGRILVHLNQRRGAFGLEIDPEDTDAGKVRSAITNVEKEMKNKGCRTFGELMAVLHGERKHAVGTKDGATTYYHDPIRNRRDRLNVDPQHAMHADRVMIWREFNLLWEKQKAFSGPLAKLLTPELKKALDNTEGDATWRYKGLLFGQRKTYWDTGTLGRCELEPTDQLCPKGDMHASEFRMLETVNRIMIEERDRPPRRLSLPEREKVIRELSKVKSPSVSTVRKALGIHGAKLKEFFTLNIEREKKAELNSDWFAREIIHGIFGRERWERMTDRERESVNRALLKFEEEETLRAGAKAWWKLNDEDTERLIQAWSRRSPKKDRVNLSRRAIIKLLPFLRQGDDVTTAKQKCGYDLRPRVLNKADRHYLKKHPNTLPPAPMLPNPVVRKAIHEVRRHINHYLRKFKRIPDRVVIELVKSATQAGKVRNEILARNRRQEAERKRIEMEFAAYVTETNPLPKIVLRVRLWREQEEKCAYTGRTIGIEQVGHGVELEADHIVPRSRGGDNGFNNKVLCFRNPNKNKGNLTPKEWLSPDDFQKLEQRFQHLDGKSSPNPRKWDNLHRDVGDLEAFVASQLTDTAYAAKQVAGYLREALYYGEKDGKKRVFTTIGVYTGILRRDWGLLEDAMPEFDHSQLEDDGPPPELTADIRARREEKDRTDHRHHAIDAVVIALTDTKLVQTLAKNSEAAAEYKERTGFWPKRYPIDPPWGDVASFRRQVLDLAQELKVAHRPVKRRLIGALHKQTPFGIVDLKKGLFLDRVEVTKLKPKMLRQPVEKKVKDKTEKGDFTIGKGGLVRDWNLRSILRKCLEDGGLDPDKYTEKQIQELAMKGEIRMPSGVPIKSVGRLRIIKEPVIIPAKTQDEAPRVYVGGNNHHMEILEDEKIGEWVGKCWDTYTVARRARPPKGQPKLPMVIGRELQALRDQDRLPPKLQSLYRGRQFVMSLAEGEMIHARRRDRLKDAADAVGYFVVVKLTKSRIFFAPHWDARKEKHKEKTKQQDRWDVTPGGLKDLGPVDGQPPYKVRVSPLGEVTRIDD